MNKTLSRVVIATGIGLACFVAFRFTSARFSNMDGHLSTSMENAPTEVQDDGLQHLDRITIGGIARPKTDVLPRTQPAPAAQGALKKVEGAAPPLNGKENSQVEQVSQALASGENPERYSSFIVPASFSLEAFTASPAEYATEYAKTIEPGRAFVCAQPSEGIGVLRAKGPRLHRLKQGESVRLQVHATPYAPVTFTSFDAGQFSNLLSSITIVAGEDGIASAEFTASSGTKRQVRILTASPVLTEQCVFNLTVASDPSTHVASITEIR